MVRRLMPICFAVLAGMLLLAGPTRAQDATPPAGGLPVTPDPSECTVPPLTVDDLIALVGSPVAASPAAGTGDGAAPSPAATPAAFALPAGEPADRATVDAITATARMALACFNAGNFLAFLALATDAQVLADFEGVPLTEEDVAFLRATPEAFDSASWNTLVAVRDVTLLPDGRAGALVDTIFPDEGPDVQTDFIYFAQEDGEWKFDGIVEDLEGQYPSPGMATPTS